MKAAIRDFLKTGGQPLRTDEPGDVGMQLDPVAFYEFRISVADAKLYVKVSVDWEARSEPDAKVRSVKLAD